MQKYHRALLPLATLFLWFVQPVYSQHQDTQEVEVFVASGCPHCRQAIRFLEDERIPFRIYDLEQDRSAQQTYRASYGYGILPLLRFRDKSIRGFNQLEILRLVKVQNSTRSQGHSVAQPEDFTAILPSAPDVVQPSMPAKDTQRSIDPRVDREGWFKQEEARGIAKIKKMEQEFNAMAEAVKEPSPEDVDANGNHPKTVLTCCSKDNPAEVYSEMGDQLYSLSGQISIDGKRFFDSSNCYTRLDFKPATFQQCFKFLAYGAFAVGGHSPVQ